LLRTGRAAKAQVVCEENLRKNREIEWALFGFAQALRAQGKNDQAAAIDEGFSNAWQHADIKLSSSLF